MLGIKGTIILVVALAVLSIIGISLVPSLNSSSLPYAPHNPITLP